MLLIEQFDDKTPTPGRFVKCPACRTGRLFDRPKSIPVKAMPANKAAVNSGAKIYIKCPKCARLIGVSFTN